MLSSHIAGIIHVTFSTGGQEHLPGVVDFDRRNFGEIEDAGILAAEGLVALLSAILARLRFTIGASSSRMSLLVTEATFTREDTSIRTFGLDVAMRIIRSGLPLDGRSRQIR